MAKATIFVPPVEDTYVSSAVRYMSASTPALGAEWIRHSVQLKHPEHDIRVIYKRWDDPIVPEQMVRPDDTFMGISCTSLSYGPALPVMEYAQSIGVPVIVGGAHARTACRQILKSRRGVGVVTGAGEGVVEAVMNGVDLDQIPGLRFNLGERSLPSPDLFSYETIPFLHQTTDYQYFFDEWQNEGQRVYHDSSASRVVSVRGITGCHYKKVCSFCAVQRIKPYDPVERGKYLVQERKNIAAVYGDDSYIRDCSDALPATRTLEAMAQERNGDEDYRVYTGAMVWDLLEGNRLELARRAGYTDFLIGLEAFCQPHTVHTGKPLEILEQLFEFLERTRGDKINLFISGIVGWPGETEETLRESAETIERLLTFPQIVSISVNYLLVLQGTILHRKLAKQGILDFEDDCLDMRQLFMSYLEQESPSMTYDRLKGFVTDMTSLDERVVQYTGFSH